MPGPHKAEEMKTQSTLRLSFQALGIVFGDIATSVLYAGALVFFNSHYALSRSYEDVIGAIALFILTLLVVSVKYPLLIMRADNQGEGGSTALLGLLRRSPAIPRGLLRVAGSLLYLGTAFLIADGIFTPAISVTSAVEGFQNLGFRSVDRLIVPFSLLVLFVLFWLQKRGTERVAKLFAPVMAAWFVALIVLAIPQIFKHPEVLNALNPLAGPRLALRLLTDHPLYGVFIVLGSIVLSITGAEAMYADMGHLGRRAITGAWFVAVLPALVVNYLGQGARLLDAAEIPNHRLFFSLVTDLTEWFHRAHIPVPEDAVLILTVLLAVASTCIASQALISGTPSLIKQASAQGTFPRLRVIHTNSRMPGQIYMPAVNWTLFAGCAALVMMFKGSEGMAAAYGIAVTQNMAITTFGLMVAAIYTLKWPARYVVPACLALISVDLLFFSANMLKFWSGGYIPICIAVALFGVMHIWQWGRNILAKAYEGYTDPKRDIAWLVGLKRRLRLAGGLLKDERVRRLAEQDRLVVFLTSRPVRSVSDTVPVTARVYMKRNGIVPREIVMLTLVAEETPYISGERYSVENLGENIFGVQVRYGFMEDPDATVVIRNLHRLGIVDEQVRSCAIKAGRDEFDIYPDATWWDRFRARAFNLLLRASTPAYAYFRLHSLGVSQTAISISLRRNRAQVEFPEFPLDSRDEEQEIDPDTRQRTEIKPVSIG